jgi:hypothetical protein
MRKPLERRLRFAGGFVFYGIATSWSPDTRSCFRSPAGGKAGWPGDPDPATAAGAES